MKKRSRQEALPDITPLIDVVFLLLIFFMVSTVFKKDELALFLNLPKAQEGQKDGRPPNKLSIELSSEELAYNGKKMSLEQLESQIKLVTEKTIPVDLRIDKDVRYEKIVKVLDLLRKQQISNLSLMTEQ